MDRETFAKLLKRQWCLDHKEFWTLHEERLNFFNNLVSYKYVYGTEKMWDGKTSLDGQNVLIYAEQGMGDQIQFARYIPLLKDKYQCNVILNCAAPLSLLFQQLDFVDKLVFKEHVSPDHMPEFDVHLPLMSLPYYLGEHDPIWRAGMFHALREVSVSNKKNVGFVLTANPRSFGYKVRSIDVSCIRECLSDDIQFYNLHHKDHANVDGVMDLCYRINDFGDLANYVAAMDVIVTIDSALLHVAGSMEKDTLALIPKEGDWKWGLEETSPWYPSVRLIHQNTEDWSTVFQEVAMIL